MSRVEAENETAGKKLCSEKQRIANAINSRRSTGPRTEAGRRRASMNRCLHGMRSTKDLIPGESAEERQQLREQIYQAVAPRDGVEELLAEQIFDSAWHVRRGQPPKREGQQDGQRPHRGGSRC